MIPLGWHQRKLGELLEIKHGFAFKSIHYNDLGIGYRLLTPAHFREYGGFRDIKEKQKYYDGPIPSGYLLSRDSLLVAMTEQAPGLLGSPVLVPEEGVYLHNQRLGLVIVKKPQELNESYLFHVFNMPSVRKQISTASGGTKVKHSSPEKIESVVWRFPPLPEQDKIVKILSQWDRAIDLTEQLVAQKLLRRKGLIQQLLSGKRRLPGFYGEFKSSFLRHHILEVSARNRGEKIQQVLSVTNDRGFIKPEDQFGRRVASANLSNYKIVERGQFAYNPSRINVGSWAMLDNFENGVISPMYVVFRTTKGIDASFLSLWMESGEGCERIRIQAQGSVRETVSFDAFGAIRMKLPPIDEQKAIANILKKTYREIELLQVKADALREQKKGFLQQLLTGKVRVKLNTNSRGEL
jgi:type I restriction enzyme S subunit